MKSMQSLKPALLFVSLAITFMLCTLAKMRFCRKCSVVISVYDGSNLTFSDQKKKKKKAENLLKNDSCEDFRDAVRLRSFPDLNSLP